MSWEVRPTHPSFDSRWYETADLAHEGAEWLTNRFGVSCELFFKGELMYEVMPLPMDMGDA